MRADRLLQMLLLLQNRGRMTAPELAAELEVSVRTVYRDAEALVASGVPLTAERGPEGGYRLMEGYRTRLTGLTGEEADSLWLAGMPGAAAELGLGAELTTAQLKLRAALPAQLAERTRRVSERFHLDAPAWFRDADPVPHLARVAEAVWEQRTLRVRYRRWKGEVRRELHPLGLVLKGGIWYLVARSAPGPEDGGGGVRPGERVRTYRVSRILALDGPGERFERPAGFGLAAYWTETTGRLEAGRLRDEALLRLSPRGLRLLPMLFGAVGARAVREAREADGSDGDGWVRVLLPVESIPVAVGDLLRLGAEAEVLGPAGLRAAVAREVEALAGRYGRGTGESA
ncbi:helix-turn-helix transcriptional regulator [Streptomyces pini]|uniref:Predicted DNA-binding transcriptional regulator YafY, contains an HTH and WYL domains n=1 Tax=Streptomyces pini TaxID=1520580 RepID=A0A1I3X699_9ACTN|nr:WYL domain-containing protein [Streptomyces pini]SFK15080.1 Predicted DNA-binding transcriptional regulator YafY, contains an HTH and WYL domains [Streptomyces pini]